MKTSGWVSNFLERIVSIQSDVLFDFPEDKRKQGYGRAARLIVDGPEGCIRELWFCEKGVQPKPPNVPVKTEVYMADNTLLDLITPDIDTDRLVALVEEYGGVDAISEAELALVTQQLYPRLDFRTALANRLISIGGDTPDVDSEEWAQIIEKVLLKVAFPLVVKAMLREKKKC